MKWFVDNWSLLVVIACVVGAGFFYGLKFTRYDKQRQIEIVKSWLLYAVFEAERIYQSGTGKLKLHYVYDLFVAKFPAVAAIVSFEIFSHWVDEALVEMRKILEYNKDIEAYINDN